MAKEIGARITDILVTYGFTSAALRELGVLQEELQSAPKRGTIAAADESASAEARPPRSPNRPSRKPSSARTSSARK